MIWSKKYIYKAGFRNGYPKCCIDAYYKDLKEHRSPAALRKIDQSGYVPCPKHYEEYKEKLRCLKALCDREEERKKSSIRSTIANFALQLKKPKFLSKNNLGKGWHEPGLLEHLMS